jgi:deazaflavin-dependent oxidoreductase (nitroreductase family)
MNWERIAAHTKLYHEDPDKAHEWINPYGNLTRALLLKVKGRTSGKILDIPLIYGQDGENYLLAGSKGGSADHPQWYKNLMANPDCEIQVGRKHFKVRARTVEGAERPRLWEILAKIFPQYEEYQSITDRQIPVVILEPRL